MLWAQDHNSLPLFVMPTGGTTKWLQENAGGDIINQAANVYTLQVDNTLQDAAGNNVQQPPDVICIPLAIAKAQAMGHAPPAAAAVVAMTPHLTNNNVIDYTTRTGSMLYKATSKGLFSNNEQEDKYDLLPKGLLTFINKLTVWAKECS